MTQGRKGAAAVALFACLLVGCGPGEDASPGGDAGTTARPSLPPPTQDPQPQQDSSPEEPLPAPAPSGLVDEDTGEVITPRALPEWDTDSRAAAAAAGEAVMQAFAQPDLDHESWWAQLAPLLSSEARLDYAYVDPANIRARQVTAEPSVAEDSSAHVARVQVPTDVGDYTVLLSRQDATSPWLTERITPPEAAG